MYTDPRKRDRRQSAPSGTKSLGKNSCAADWVCVGGLVREAPVAAGHRANIMGGESSDDEAPEQVSLQSGRSAALQQRSLEKEGTRSSRARRQEKQETAAEQRKVVSAALKSERFPTELLGQLPTAGWGAPAQPKRASEEEPAEAERGSKRARKRRPEAKPGMPKVFRRSHNLEVAVAAPVNSFQSGADLQAFLHEQLYGDRVKRTAGATFGSQRRAGAATNFGTAAPPPNRPTKPKKEKVDRATRLTGQVLSSTTTPLERRAAKLAR